MFSHSITHKNLGTPQTFKEEQAFTGKKRSAFLTSKNMPNAQDTCLRVDQEENFLSRNYQISCSPEKAELPNSKFTSEKAHARTICLCSKECFSSPVNASHNFLQKIRGA